MFSAWLECILQSIFFYLTFSESLRSPLKLRFTITLPRVHFLTLAQAMAAHTKSEYTLLDGSLDQGTYRSRSSKWHWYGHIFSFILILLLTWTPYHLRHGKIVCVRNSECKLYPKVLSCLGVVIDVYLAFL